MNSPYIYTLRKAGTIIMLLCLNLYAFSQTPTVEASIISLKAINNTDTAAKIYLRQIFVTGNKKTKDYIITRHIPISPGDTVSAGDLISILEKARQFIYNTTLFTEVVVQPVLINAFEFNITVAVKERWYIYPLPEVQVAEGTINEWLTKYKGDLTRLNYGLKFTHNNLTGRKDQLRINLLNGYTKTISFNYNAPFSNTALTNGFAIGGGYFKNREIAYKTSYNNEFVFYKRNNFVRNAWEIRLGYSIRKGQKVSHAFSLNYINVSVEDSVISETYNKSYFNNNIAQIGFIDMFYTLRYTDVNNILYPLTGISGNIIIAKRGFGLSGSINSFSIDGEFNKFISLGKKWYAGAQVQGNIKLPFTQAYINQRALGFGNNYIRGMEFKIIDGVAFAIAKFNLRKEIFNFSINTIFKKSKTLNKIPFRIYAKTFTDLGYVYNKEEFISRLNNKFLRSGGVGLDIVTFYDMQIRIEYSLNQLGQKRLFLHNEKGF